MLKTITVNKHMRLDELIKYVWENSVNEKRVFLGNHGQRVVFDDVGGFYPSGYAYSPDSTFTVEVEEEITEDTELDCVISVDSDGYTFKTFNTSIDYVNSTYSDIVQILANIDGKYRTVWESGD